MAVIPEGNESDVRVYRAIVAENRYPLTHHGDLDLRPSFGEAVIRAAVIGTPEDPRQDAESIARYISGLPIHTATLAELHVVQLTLAISELSDEEFDADGYDRESVTIALIAANDAFREKLKLAQRPPVLGLADV